MPRVRIVLVEPSHPGNIGGAARAMKTMGFSMLALVRPKRFPDPQADWRAAGALDVIENAEVFATLPEAIAQSVFVAGTSARRRRVPWPVMTSSELASTVHSDFTEDHEVSVVFGREDSGLTNEELNLCNVHVRIPSNPVYSSLNLAMSVQVVVYDLFRSADGKSESVERDWDKPPATSSQKQDLYMHLERVLTQIEFYEPADSRHAIVRLHRLFNRVDMDHTEVQIFRGILTQIERALERHKTQ